MRNRRTLRYGPALLTLLVAVVIIGAMARAQGQEAQGMQGLNPVVFTSPVEPPPCEVVEALLTISSQAASLTGQLALVDADVRPAAAASAAAQIRALTGEASAQQGGADLVWILIDLAESLDKYAGGDPAGLAGVREASARNARLREQLSQHPKTCGGEEQ